MECKLNSIEEVFKGSQITTEDADIIQQEMQFLFKMLHFAAEAGRMKSGGPDIENLESRVVGLKNDHKQIWLQRNRIGGLQDSASKLKVEWLKVKKES
jgi:hypothetical protein